MEIRLASDLHLEHVRENIPLHETNFVPRLDDDSNRVLVLAGDITSQFRAIRKNPGWDEYTPWLRNLLPRFKHVVYVLGNHDLWAGGHYPEVYDYWMTMAEHRENLHVLQNSSVVLDGVRFAGGTMWTDISERGAYAMMDFLKARGIETVLLSGDRKEKCNSMAQELGIDQVYA